MLISSIKSHEGESGLSSPRKPRVGLSTLGACPKGLDTHSAGSCRQSGSIEPGGPAINTGRLAITRGAF